MDGHAGRLPTKVLMTADTVGGVWTYALELIRGLAPHGICVALATMGAPLTREQWQEIADLDNVEVFESNFRLEWMDDPWADVRHAGQWLLGIEERFEPDLVHLNGYAHAALPWSAPTLVVGHSCVLSWWRAVKGCEAPVNWSTYRDAVRTGLRAADLVVAPSRAMLEALENHYGPLADSIVIPNGRAMNCSPPSRKQEIVLVAGRLWDEAKNIQALASVAHRLPWPVCLAGDSKNPNGTSAAFKNVHVLGRLSTHELSDWYCDAAIYALPARYEPFGLSALEAASAECALVLGDIPSLREVWGDAALFVPPDNDNALLRALFALIEDTELRAEMGRRAYNRSREFTPDRTTGEYLAAYRQLLAAGEPPELRMKSRDQVLQSV